MCGRRITLIVALRSLRRRGWRTKGSGDVDRVGDDRVRQTRFEAGSSGLEETGADRFFLGRGVTRDASALDVEEAGADSRCLGGDTFLEVTAGGRRALAKTLATNSARRVKSESFEWSA